MPVTPLPARAHPLRPVRRALGGAALALACAASTAGAAELRVDDRVVSIEPALIGYNIGTWRTGPGWEDPGLRQSLRRLRPGLLRYPGGTLANYWDWRSGRTIETISSGNYRYDDSYDRLRPGDVVAGMPDGTEIVYVVNMARPTPTTGVTLEQGRAAPRSLEILDAKIEDALDGLREFRRAGHRVRRVMLGNEFYQGALGEVAGQGAIYTGDVELYIEHADRFAEALRGFDPAIRIGVIGESPRGAVRITDWTRALYDAVADGRLDNVDGVSFHWYSGPGVEKLTGAADAEASLAQAYGFVERRVTDDLAALPAGLEAWSDEYNTFSRPKDDRSGIDGGPIQGTWTNGLFTAILTLRQAALDERIAMLVVHNIAFTGNLQWNMLRAPDTLSGNGLAMGAIGRAFIGRTELQELLVDGLARPTTPQGTPAVHGLRLSGGGGEALAIVNATREPVDGLDLSGALLRGGRYQLEQHHDVTPTTRAPDGGAVRQGPGGGIASRWSERRGTGQLVDLPPFSLTVIRSLED